MSVQPLWMAVGAGAAGGHRDADGRLVGLQDRAGPWLLGCRRAHRPVSWWSQAVRSALGVGARRGTRKLASVDPVEEGDPALLGHPDGETVGRRPGCRVVVSRRAVGDQRGGQVVPGPHGVDGGHRHRDVADRAGEGHQPAVGQAHAVLQHGQLEGLPAAVGDAGHGDVRLDQPLVDQQPGQVLGVADLVALVGQVDPSLGAGRGVGPAGGGAARVTEAPGRVHQHGVAVVGQGHVVDPAVVRGRPPSRSSTLRGRAGAR